MTLSLSRDSWLALGLILLLVLVTIAAAIQQTDSSHLPALTSASSAPTGGRALSLWLGQLGYTVDDKVPATFQPPSNTSLILLLEPITEVTVEEWQLLDNWVEGGGTLLLAGEGYEMAEAAGHY